MIRNSWGGAPSGQRTITALLVFELDTWRELRPPLRPAGMSGFCSVRGSGCFLWWSPVNEGTSATSFRISRHACLLGGRSASVLTPDVVYLPLDVPAACSLARRSPGQLAVLGRHAHRSRPNCRDRPPSFARAHPGHSASGPALAIRLHGAQPTRRPWPRPWPTKA